MKPGGWPSILAVYLFGICGASTFSKLIPMAAGLGREFAMGPIEFAWLIGLFAVPAALFAIPSGMVVARYGPKAVMIGAGLLGVAANALYLVADTRWLIYAVRTVEGLAVVHIYTSGPALLMASTDGKRRTAAMTVWTTYAPVGTALGIAMSGLVAAGPDWRLGFAGHGAIFLVATVLAFMQPKVESGTPQGGLGARVRELLGALGARPLQAVGVAFFLLVTLGIGGSVTFPEYFAAVDNLPIANTSSMVAAATLLMIPGSIAAGTLLARGTGAGRLFALLCTLVLVSGALAYVPQLSATARWLPLIGWYVGSGGTLAVLMATLPEVATPSQRPALLALINEAGAMATLLSPPIWLGALEAGNWLLFLPLLAACNIIALLLFGYAHRAGSAHVASASA